MNGTPQVPDDCTVRWPGARVLPGQHNVPEDVVQSLLHRLSSRDNEDVEIVGIPGLENEGGENLRVIEIHNSMTISIEDSTDAVYTFFLDPDRLDIEVSRTPEPCCVSNMMLTHDYRSFVYMTGTLAGFLKGGSVPAQARIHSVTQYLLNQISKDMFAGKKTNEMSIDDFSRLIREFSSRYYYLAGRDAMLDDETAFWNMTEQLFTPSKLYEYMNSFHVQGKISSGGCAIDIFACLMEKIDTLARDPFAYVGSKDLFELSLEKVESLVGASLLEEFLFPAKRVGEVLSRLPADDVHLLISSKYSVSNLATLLVRHYCEMSRARKALSAIKVIQFDLTSNLIMSGSCDFDTSRRIVNRCIEDFDAGVDPKDMLERIITIMSSLFSAEFSQQLPRLLSRHHEDILVRETISDIPTLESVSRELIGGGELSELEKQIISDKYRTWSAHVEETAKDVLDQWLEWQTCVDNELAALEDETILLSGSMTPGDVTELNRLLCYLLPRAYQSGPRFKDLMKPTIIFIHGGAGVGKSTIGNVTAKKLGIPTYFRATITREILRHFIPPDIAGEIHRSSYQGEPTIEGFYDQGLRVSSAMQAVLDRTIKENSSVMIESGVLLPGALPSRYYKSANIVELFLSAPDNKMTHRRMLVGSVSLGKDREKRLRNFQSIRLIDFVLKKLATDRHITVIEHDDMDKVIDRVIRRALDPYSDRWPGMIHDSIIEKVIKMQATQKIGYVRLPLSSRETFNSAEIPEPEKEIDVSEDFVSANSRLLAHAGEALEDLRTREFKLLGFLLSQVDEPYDHVRQKLYFLLNNSRTHVQLQDHLKEFLYPVVISNLRKELEEDGYDPDELLGRGSYESLVYDLWDIPEVRDIHMEKYRSMLKHWEDEIESYARDHFDYYTVWKNALQGIEEKIRQERDLASSRGRHTDTPVFRKFENFSTGPNADHQMKSLEKPLIVLVSGASGTGKSTLAKALKRAFNIPTSFSTDLVRENIRKLVPADIWPEVHTSSFKLPEEQLRHFAKEYERIKGTKGEADFLDEWRSAVLKHYYAHSFVILEGVQAAINRQIERNQSIIIEGIPLIPGALPSHYHEDANIVQLVVSVNDENEHLSRWDKRALEQPDRYKEGSKRYRESFIPIRFISRRLEDVARMCSVKVVNNENLEDALSDVVEYVGGSTCDRYVKVDDPYREKACSYLLARARSPLPFWGAWCTDIDDTVVLSGCGPTDEQVRSINRFVRALSRWKIAWVPMSGVAFEKIRPRILDRIDPDLKDNVMFYGGDGSSKYCFDKECGEWKKDPAFERLLSDAQALAILGEDEFSAQLEEHLRSEDSGLRDFSSEVDSRIEKAKGILREKGFSPGIVDELKKELERAGFDPERSEAYYRGGSVSWMMLGDIDAESYAEEHAEKTRNTLLDMVDRRLSELGFLRGLSPEATRVLKPFPGARGIKFVLEGNDKSRCIRDLMQKHGLLAEEIIFAGNEIFSGGNDYVVASLEGVNLISFGKVTAEGVTRGGAGVEANRMWYETLSSIIEGISPDGGDPWLRLLANIRDGQLDVGSGGNREKN